MKNDDFGKMDEAFLKETEKLRKKQVPSEVLKGFSASVKAKIREKEIQKVPLVRHRRFGLPLWAPALAVLLVVSVAALRGGMGIWMRPGSAGLSEMAEEILVLQEFGAWTEEDEHVLNGNYEAAAEELSLEGLR